MTARDELKALVDGMSEVDARLWLAALRDHDRVALALVSAPFDDEPETAEEHAAVEAAYEDIRAGRVVGWEELKRDLGL